MAVIYPIDPLEEPGAIRLKIPYRAWATEFETEHQTWVISIEVAASGDHFRPCTLIDPHGNPRLIFPEPGTYKIIFPSGSLSPLRSLAIDPDPGTGRRIP